MAEPEEPLAPPGQRVISASRRTDIPAFFGDWLMAGLKRGHVLVRNPFRPSQERQVSLRREDVAAFVFWTRNPIPFMPVIDFLLERGDPFYFLVTFTGYSPPLERDSPGIEAARAFFRELARHLGRERVVWRYDPVFFTSEMDLAFHRDRFAALAKVFAPWCRRVIVSFWDSYAKAGRRLERAGIAPLRAEERPQWVKELLSFMAGCSRDEGLEVQACAEKLGTTSSGVPAGKCVDDELLRSLFGLEISYRKDPGQRGECRCHCSVDIGTYGTCRHGCLYCYAC